MVVVDRCLKRRLPVCQRFTAVAIIGQQCDMAGNLCNGYAPDEQQRQETEEISCAHRSGGWGAGLLTRTPIGDGTATMTIATRRNAGKRRASVENRRVASGSSLAPMLVEEC